MANVNNKYDTITKQKKKLIVNVIIPDEWFCGFHTTVTRLVTLYLNHLHW